MVQIKVFVAALAAGFVQNALAGACKPKSYTSSAALSTNGIEVSYSVVETTNTAESYSETQLSSIFESSTDEVTTSVATSSETQPTTTIEVSSSMVESTNSLELSSTEIMTTSMAASTMTLDTTTTALEITTTSTSAGPSEPTWHGVYLGECQDLCKAHINCELIVYNPQIGQCFLMEHIRQGSGWYHGPSNSLVRYDNSCEIEKREPDPICEKWGFCPDCEAVHQRGGYTRMTCHAACLASDECESFTTETTISGCFFNKKWLFKSGFFPGEEGRLWFDNACDVIDG
ncbi:uncharacterized protein B0J16DRAFT_398677 [Fusarium flagelliforme]|uniref:uncharacterized protein n=1 Tax=Fusarium flagelliforme TaxID=2675880 RepID=UPI001E8EB294|nr:uncharacterized protein B0J16DRAFT_398677 [Fusarium flagelliforme]KAH7185039.1 hypothetical protein B0J16DRAFT_398677 [Fusarium flagelliforme]